MNISAVNSGGTASVSSIAGQKAAASTSSTSRTKDDTAIISQKAKDLAAQQAGKSSQEEMSESFAAKMQEGPNS